MMFGKLGRKMCKTLIFRNIRLLHMGEDPGLGGGMEESDGGGQVRVVELYRKEGRDGTG